MEAISSSSDGWLRKRDWRRLLTAWQQFPGQLKILGDGPLADMVAARADRDESIEWLGHQSGDAVLSVLSGAIGLIVPSMWYEGLPKTIIEAFSVGTPVIASDLGAMSEVIEPQQTGLLFKTGDAQALCDALRWMIQDPSRVQAMRSQVRSVFEQRYTADRNFQLLKEIYDQVVATEA